MKLSEPLVQADWGLHCDTNCDSQIVHQIRKKKALSESICDNSQNRVNLANDYGQDRASSTLRRRSLRSR